MVPAPSHHPLAPGAPLASDTAFDAYVRRHTPLITRVCQRVLRCPADAADAAQLVFLRCLRHWPDPVVEQRAWLAAVALNVCRDWRRGRDRRRTHEVLAGRAQARQAQTEATAAEADDGLLTGLAPEDRVLLHLRFVEGMTTRAVATATRLSPAAVDSRIRRLRARIRRRAGLTRVLLGAWRGHVVARPARVARRAPSRSGHVTRCRAAVRWRWVRGSLVVLLLGVLGIRVLPVTPATAASASARGHGVTGAAGAGCAARRTLLPGASGRPAEEAGATPIADADGVLRYDAFGLGLSAAVPEVALLGPPRPLPTATASAPASTGIALPEAWPSLIEQEPGQAWTAAQALGLARPAPSCRLAPTPSGTAVLHDPIAALAFLLANHPWSLRHAHIYLPSSGLPPVAQVPQHYLCYAPDQVTAVWVVGIVVDDVATDALSRRVRAHWGNGLVLPDAIAPDAPPRRSDADADAQADAEADVWPVQAGVHLLTLEAPIPTGQTPAATDG